MYVKNVLSSGDFCTLVPVGIPIMLQYDANGYVERVYRGFEHRSLLDTTFLELLQENNIIPPKIKLSGGTTYVHGVLYSAHVWESSGVFPIDFDGEMESYFYEYPARFKFFAGTVSSMASFFSGHAVIRQWLKSNGFQVLPGFIVPAHMNESVFYSNVREDTFPFRYPLIMYYMVLRGADTTYVFTKLRQNKIVSRADEIEFTGEVDVTFSLENGPDYVCNYSDVVYQNIHEGDYLVFDRYSEMMQSFSTEASREQLDTTYTCPICGKITQIQEGTILKCSDRNCPSNTRADALHFIRSIGLPSISCDTLTKYVLAHKYNTIMNILDLPEYRGRSIEADISTIIYACIPISYRVTEAACRRLCSRCNGNLQSIVYYIKNPDNIGPDFSLTNREDRNLQNALHMESYVTYILYYLNHCDVKLIDRGKTFSGAPIFRNKRILITGDFKRGSDEYIIGILSSYAATVVTKYDNLIDCVITGGTQTNVDGTAIRAARISNVPIYDEDSFFNAYDIDSDIADNLE